MQRYDTELTKMLGMDFPIIMAPMFLVSNAAMVIEAVKHGITGAIPALNYRTDKDMRAALEEIKNAVDGPIGINLVVNKSNYKLKAQLQACVDYEIDFVITSLGGPHKIMDACKAKNIKVFCDVIDLNYAKKCESLGADGLIAVNSEAGGHLGPMKPEELIPLLLENCNLPVISAGGVGKGSQLLQRLQLGACGVSIGSPFIATSEAPVSNEYKQACVDYGAEDIVTTTKISGTPCTIINTPYVQKIGTEQNWVEKMLAKNKRIKKWVKMMTFLKGMKAVERAAFKATYKTVWCAGPSIEYVDSIRPCGEVIDQLITEFRDAVAQEDKEIVQQ